MITPTFDTLESQLTTAYATDRLPADYSTHYADTVKPELDTLAAVLRLSDPEAESIGRPVYVSIESHPHIDGLVRTHMTYDLGENARAHASCMQYRHSAQIPKAQSSLWIERDIPIETTTIPGKVFLFAYTGFRAQEPTWQLSVSTPRTFVNGSQLTLIPAYNHLKLMVYGRDRDATISDILSAFPWINSSYLEVPKYRGAVALRLRQYIFNGESQIYH